MHIRCPHCHQPVELVENARLEQIDCPSCGSQFNLLGEETVDRRGDEGRTIGHFELIEKLGMGQFGTVWKARDTELDRTVAVKIPRQEHLNLGDAELFLREARAAAQLRHPNIVGVHEVGRERDTVYIVSDLVQGTTLADRLSAGRLSPREAAQLCAVIADALQHAHQAGVIHRDLKPSNIMLDADGQPHLMDFGLAKREAGEVTMTMDGRILGTPAYMSPEQARGEAHDADARSDIYSLGTILFELLTGELPFRGNKRMLLMQIMHDEPPGPRKLDAAVPRDLETICLKCLEKSPERRYATARYVADELRRYLAGQPIRARPVTRVERSWRWCRRNPLVAGMAAAVAAALLAGTIISGYFATQSDRRALAESKARREAVEARNDAGQHALDAYESVVEAAHDHARSLRTARQPHRQRQALARIEQAAAVHPMMKDLSNSIGAAAFNSRDEHLDRFWSEQFSRLNSEAAWWLTQDSIQPVVELRLPVPGKEDGIPPFRTGHTRLAFSADGALVARGIYDREGSRAYRAAMLSGGRAQRSEMLEKEGPTVYHIEIVAVESGIIQVTCPLESLGTRTVLQSATIGFAGDPCELVVGRYDLSIEDEKYIVAMERYAIDSGALTRRLPLEIIDGLRPDSIVLSPDGSRVLVSAFHAADSKPWAAVYDSDDGRRLHVFDDSTFFGVLLPSASHIVGLRLNGQEAQSLEVVELTTGRAAPSVALDSFLTGLPQVGQRHLAYNSPACFSADGRWLAWATAMYRLALIDLQTGTIAFCDVPAGKSLETSSGLPCALSADGRLLASVTDDRLHVQIVDGPVLLSTSLAELPSAYGAPQNTRRLHTSRLAFLDDGRRIAVAQFDAQTRDEIISVWDLSIASVRTLSIVAGGRTDGIRFGLTGRRVLRAAGDSGKVDAFNLSSLTRSGAAPITWPNWRYVSPAQPPTTAGFDSASQVYIHAGDNGIRLIDAATGQLKRSLDDKYLLARSSDDHRYLLVRERTRVGMGASWHVFDVANDRWVAEGADAAWRKSAICGMSADGRFVLAWAVTGELRVVSLPDGKTLYESEQTDWRRRAPVLHSASGQLAFFGYGAKIEANDEALYVADLNNGQTMKVPGSGSPDNVRGGLPIVFSPDGQRLLFFEPDSRSGASTVLKVWSRQRPATIELAGHWSRRGSNATFVGDGTSLFVSGLKTEGEGERGIISRRQITKPAAELWDISHEPRLLTTFRPRDVGALCVSYDTSIAVRESSGTKVVDVVSGKTIAEHPGVLAGYVGGEDRRRAVSLFGSNSVVIDLSTGRAAMTLDGSTLFGSGAHESPNGVWRLTNANGRLFLWNLLDRTGVPLNCPPENALGFTPDSKQMLIHEPARAPGLQLWKLDERRPSHVISLDWPGHLSGVPQSLASVNAISPDGKKVALNVHGQVRLATVDSGRIIAALSRSGHSQRVRALDTSADGRLLATASDDQTVGLWDARDGREAGMLEGFPAAVANVAFFPDSHRLATLDSDGRLVVWRLNARESDGRLYVAGETIWAHPSAVAAEWNGTRALAVRPDGKSVALSPAPNVVKVFDAEHGKVSRTLVAEASIGCLSFCQDKWLAGGAGNGDVYLWDIETDRPAATWRAGQGPIHALAAQPGSDVLVTAGRDVRLWSVPDGQLLLVLDSHTKSVRDVAFSQDGRMLATAGDDQSLVWPCADLDAALGKLKLGWSGRERRPTAPATVARARPADQSQETVAGRLADKSIVRNEPATPAESVAPSDEKQLFATASPVTSIAYSPAAPELASGGWDGTVRFWNVVNREQRLILKRHDKAVWGLVYFDDGRRLATSGDDAKIRICDAIDGGNEVVIESAGPVHALARHPDGKHLSAAGHDGNVTFVDVQTGETTSTISTGDKPLWGLAFSPDGTRLATSGVDPVIRLWDTASGAAAGELTGHTNVVWSLAFSPDGSRLASASDDWSVRIWDATAGRELATLGGHTISPYSVSFSRDGRLLSSAAAHRWKPPHPGEVIVWKTDTWQAQTYPSTTNGFFAAAFQPDGGEFAAAGSDGRIRLWKTPEKWDSENEQAGPVKSPTDFGARLLADGSTATWSPDGKLLFYAAAGASGKRGIHRLDMETRGVSQVIEDGKDPALSPSGKFLAFVRGGDTAHEEIWLAAEDGAEAVKLAAGGFPRWAADSGTLYFHSRRDGVMKAIDVADARRPIRDVAPCKESYYPVVSPDGKYIAYVAAGTVVVIDLSSNERRTHVLSGANGGFVGWSPDGKRLAYGGYGANDRVGLWDFDLNRNTTTRLLAGPYTMPSWSPDGKWLAFDLRTASGSQVLAIETKLLTAKNEQLPP